MSTFDNIDPETGEVTDISTERATNLITEAFRAHGVAVVEHENGLDIQRRIVERMMGAKSLDELFAQREVLTSDKMVGKVVSITDVAWDVYNSDAGPLPLARVKCLVKGEKKETEFITTAPNITGFLARAVQLKALPFSAKISETATARGFKTLFLDRA